MSDTIDTILPTEYVPRTINDFYGPARIIAQRLVNSAKMTMPRKAPASHLLVGPSGSGKSALASFALDTFEIAKWNRHEIFGSDLTKEGVQEISFNMRLSNLYGGYRAWFFDEIDKCTKEARDRLLEVVGERQPKETLIIATSNLSIAEFDAMEKNQDARGRFSSRFQVSVVPGPTAADVVALLKRWLPERQAQQIAEVAELADDGRTKQPINVRALLKDVLTVMQSQ